MNKKLLLIASGIFFLTIGAKAQYTDVTEQYIPNAGFEECEALPLVPYHDVQKNIDINKIELYQESTKAKGFDYADNGWKLVQQETAVNGGVITYGCNVQTGKWATAGEPGPESGITGTKGLCFVGNKGLVYQQTDEITLAPGIYRFTVNLYARNGQTTNPGPTQQVVNIKTGFMPTGGTEDNLIPSVRKSLQFTSNAWSQEVLDIELTEATSGRFQISYGTSYYVVVDDVKLEYLGGVITTALSSVVTKAQTLNSLLGTNSDLSTAIGNAETFIANPTIQEDVATQVETLYTAMSTALATVTEPIEITSAYVENASFETGKLDAWVCEDAAIKDVNTDSPVTPRCDGEKMLEGSYATVSQVISHLPAGYYLLSAKLAGTTKLNLGATSSSVTGGTNSTTPLFLRVYTPAVSVEAGDLTVGASTGTFKIDDFHLFYAKDATSLETLALAAVKADATAILAESQYNNITGEERSETATALEGTDYKAINTKLNKFVSVKTSYDDFASAKQKAASYNITNYPYADKTMLSTVETICGTTAQSSTSAKEMTAQLKAATDAIPMSNAYCEGVTDKVDYTSQIVAANAASGSLTGWTVNNIQVCTLSSGKARPIKDEITTDKDVYGTPDTYKSGTASMQQTINNLAAGTYVLSVSMMATTNLPVAVRIDGTKINTFTGAGTATTTSWREVVSTFEQAAEANVIIRLDEGEDATTKLWYADNFRLYRINGGSETAIRSITNETANGQYFDLSGRRVTQPTKGLYIINGKKVMVK